MGPVTVAVATASFFGGVARSMAEVGDEEQAASVAARIATPITPDRILDLVIARLPFARTHSEAVGSS
jgi:hypothetical protein